MKKMKRVRDSFGSLLKYMQGYVYTKKANKKFTKQLERTNYHAVKSDKVNAPVIEKFPVAMECELLEFVDTENVSGIVGKIVNVKAEQTVLSENGKVNPMKFKALMFSQFQNGYYYSTGKTVGQKLLVHWTRSSLKKINI